jgi:predicted dehydrogenase
MTPTSTPIRTCVLGVGLAGLTFHVPFVLALPELFTLTAVLERNPSSPGGKLQERFGVSVRIHRTLHAVFEDPNIDLVVVGTPNATHYEFAKLALLAGKHGVQPRRRLVVPAGGTNYLMTIIVLSTR